MNIQPTFRQDSRDSNWDEKLRTPKEAWPETPSEHYDSQVGVRDAVEEHFDHLLVSRHQRELR